MYRRYSIFRRIVLERKLYGNRWMRKKSGYVIIIIIVQCYADGVWPLKIILKYKSWVERNKQNCVKDISLLWPFIYVWCPLSMSVMILWYWNLKFHIAVISECLLSFLDVISSLRLVPTAYMRANATFLREIIYFTA